KAEVTYINAYSAHADRHDLDEYVHSIEGLQRLILVHGEPEQMDPFGERMKNAIDGLEVLKPERDEAIEV
ncbi:hypothetical protein COW95_02955, partial [Candidatus Peregrinibacteria bacterium CG22_combo_CG10-13_8_21_14_all_49_11]